MQVLGVPVSLWNLEVPDDLLESSLLEGFSILSHSWSSLPFPPSDIVPLRKFSAPKTLLAHSLFHPPLSHSLFSS